MSQIVTRSRNISTNTQNTSIKLSSSVLTDTLALTEKVHTLKQKNSKLESEIKRLQSNGVNQTISSSNNRVPTMRSSDLWFNDAMIQAYYDSFSLHILKFRNDILLAGPAISQVLRNGNLHDILTVLTPLNYENINIAFFAINNYTEQKENDETHNYNLSRGSHWSLLVFYKLENKFHHYDSIRGLNHNQALKLARNLSTESKLIEKNAVQQTNNFECGIHVLVNTKSVIDDLMKVNTNTNIIDSKSTYINEVSPTEITVSRNLNVPIETPYSKQDENKHEEISFLTTKGNRKSARNYKRNNDKQNSFTINCNNRFSILSPEKDIYESTFENCDLPIKVKIKSNCRKKPCKREPQKNIKKFGNSFLDTKYKIISDPTTASACRNQVTSDKSFHNQPTSIQDTNKKLSKDKVRIIGDSHSRHIRQLLNKELCDNFEVYSSIKPNGRVFQVLNDINYEMRQMKNTDYVIIIAGTNDIRKDLDHNSIIKEIKTKLMGISNYNDNTNIIITALPFRYDIPFFNQNIRKINDGLQQLCNSLLNVNFLPVNFLRRQHYTKHGLHLNKFGKIAFSQSLSKLITENMDKCGTAKPIPVRITQRNSFLKPNLYLKNLI